MPDKLTKQQALDLYDSLLPHLEAIEALFKQPLVTLVVRAPQLPDGDLVLTQDEPQKIIESVEKLMAREPDLVQGETRAIDLRHVV